LSYTGLNSSNFSVNPPSGVCVDIFIATPVFAPILLGLSFHGRCIQWSALRLLRRQLVRQLGPLAFDHDAHFI